MKETKEKVTVAEILFWIILGLSIQVPIMVKIYSLLY